ncbi:MAG TPA: hypothetical protein VNT01_04470 [Symbiobacteriaceae bacterium]|nr:hypothetical protein [Symbiobacteriaceae bacterium]
MGERRRAPRPARQRPASPGRDKLTTTVDSAILANIRDLARRKDAHISEIMDLALRRVAMEDAAARTDSLLAPLVDRVIETRLKSLECGLRKMIARLAFENLSITYILCNFIVEANVPPGKVEKWRTDGRKFAVQEFRKRRNEYEDAPEDEEP